MHPPRQIRFRDFASISRLPGEGGNDETEDDKPEQQLDPPPPRRRGFKRSSRIDRLARREQQMAVRTVNVFNTELRYRVTGCSVLFQTDCVVPLIERLIPMRCGVSALKAGAKIITNGLAVKEFVSWNSLKLLINDTLFNQSLRDMLNSYDPSQKSDASSSGAGKLEKDHLSILGVDVTFVVSKGKVFFEILGAFSLLGELKLAMRHRWETVDTVLEEHGLFQREAFRRVHKKANTAGAQNSSSQRSHISLKAMLCLIENGVVKGDDRKKILLNVLGHLEKEVCAIGERKQRLYDELQYTVDMVNGFTRGKF